MFHTRLVLVMNRGFFAHTLTDTWITARFLRVRWWPRPVSFGRDIEIVAAYETLSETYWSAPNVEPNFTSNWVEAGP